MERKTAKEYKQEHDDLTVKLTGLEKRIEKRFLTLCKEHPDVVLYQSGIETKKDVLAGWFCENSPERVPKLTTEAILQFIALIEKHLADLHPHKQTSINF